VSRLKEQIQEQAASSRRRNGVDAAIEQLPEGERADLISAILDPSIPLQAITEVMRQRGIRLSTHSIRKARRGELICEP